MNMLSCEILNIFSQNFTKGKIVKKFTWGKIGMRKLFNINIKVSFLEIEKQIFGWIKL